MAKDEVTQQEFVVTLTQSEVNEKRDSLVTLENELDYAKERKKNVVAEHTGYVKSLERERGDLLRAINNRSEKRKVDVQEEFRFETNSAVMRRLDTREIISERPLEPWERQQEMFDGKSDTEPPPELKTQKANGQRKKARNARPNGDAADEGLEKPKRKTGKQRGAEA